MVRKIILSSTLLFIGLFLFSCQKEKMYPWVQIGETSLDSGFLNVKVKTEEMCCGDATEQGGTPAKFYIASLDRTWKNSGNWGFVCILGKKDKIVLIKEIKQGYFSEEVYRSSEPAIRENGWVNIKIPADVLPKEPLKIWSGKDLEMKVEINLPNRGISAPPSEPYPYVLITPGT